MFFTVLLVFLAVAGLTHILITAPIVAYACRRGFLTSRWQKNIVRVAIPLILFVVVGATFEIAEELRRQEMRAVERAHTLQRAVLIKNECGDKPNEDSIGWYKHMLCVLDASNRLKKFD